MTALGNYYQAGIPDGWSPLGGQVVSTFGVGVNPGGSSTGSAVALAAGMAAATIGEETMGSIVSVSSLPPWGAVDRYRRVRLISMGYGA
jgi:amidase